MPDEGTAGAQNDTSTATPTTSWYHIYVPFNSGTITDPGYTPDVPNDPTADPGVCLPNPTVSQPMGSFLHLGAMDPNLLDPSLIASSVSDTNAQATFKRALTLTGFVANGFLDDYRVRSTDASTTDQRQAESQNLYTKGGWRDHTDGNRITTTVGDKIEVIGGNHVMMILGRPMRDNGLNNSTMSGSASSGALIDVSGGLAYSNDAGPGHVEEVRWVTRSYPTGASADTPGAGGTWMVRQKSQFGDEVSISAGLGHESSVGIGVEINSGTTYSYHGALENFPADLLNNPNVNLTNIWRDENVEASAPYFGDMTASETLLTSIINNRDKVYSAAAPVVTDMAGGESVADTMKTTLYASTAMPPQCTYEYTNLDSTYANSTVGTVEEHSTINISKTETTTINGDNTETTTVNGNTHEIEMIAGSKTEVHLIAGPVQEVSLYIGIKEAISLNLSNEFTLDIALAKEEISIFAAHAEINLSPEKLTYANDETDIKALETKIAPLETKIGVMQQNIAGVHANGSAFVLLG